MISLSSLVIILTILVSACSPAKSQAGSQELKMAPMSMLPEEMQSAPVSVRESYQFALANPDVFKQIPCYCGCGSMGHTSNYSCYIQGEQDGETQFDAHALGCGICVDITQDSMRMLKEGKTVAEIRAAVDAKYVQYGPSNMP
jgi:Protein of unknown function with PCYCGC motif